MLGRGEGRGVGEMQSIAAGPGGTNSEHLTSYSGCVQGLAAHNWSGYTVSSPAMSLKATVTHNTAPPAAEGMFHKQHGI